MWQKYTLRLSFQKLIAPLCPILKFQRLYYFSSKTLMKKGIRKDILRKCYNQFKPKEKWWLDLTFFFEDFLRPNWVFSKNEGNVGRVTIELIWCINFNSLSLLKVVCNCQVI